MKKELHLYLAHQFKHRHVVREFELYLEKRYSIILDNPFYSSNSRQDIEMADKGIEREFTDEDVNRIVENDLRMIRDNNGILAIIIDQEALGSYMEIFYCARMLQRPVYVICPERKIREHIWIRKHSSMRFESVGQFEEWLKKNGY